MKRLIRSAAVIAGACLATSCAPEPLAGVYRGLHFEAIKIDRDSQVLWQPPKKSSRHADEFQLIGRITRPGFSDVPHLVVHSASPHLHTAISVSDDKKTITLDWRTRYAGGTEKRSVRYIKE